jgi:hypothetical protein
MTAVSWMLHESHHSLKLAPNIIKKSGRPRSWVPVVTQLILEMLVHRTPPTCIGPNILLTLELLVPNTTIMEEGLGIRLSDIAECCSTGRVVDQGNELYRAVFVKRMLEGC